MASQFPPRRAALIVNANARSGRAQLKDARRLFLDRGFDLTIVRGITRGDGIGSAVEAAINSGVPIVIIGGGDGTLRASVKHFIGRGTTLGVLPLGTANSFARALELPLKLADAVDAIAGGASRLVDLIEIDGHHYAGCASIGLAPQIAETIPKSLKGWTGRPGYLLWAAVQLACFSPFKMRLQVDGSDQKELEAVEVRIANGPYHGGVKLVESASLDSGRIVLQAVVGERRRHLVMNWAAHAVGSDARWRQICQFEGCSMRLETTPPVPISIDGEVLAHTPVNIHVKPKALKVAVQQ